MSERPSPSTLGPHEQLVFFPSFSLAPLASFLQNFLRLRGPSYAPCFYSRCSPGLRPYFELRPSLSLSLSISVSFALTLSSHLPRSFPPTHGDLEDPICRPS